VTLASQGCFKLFTFNYQSLVIFSELMMVSAL
jgi:hypothetical protein